MKPAGNNCIFCCKKKVVCQPLAYMLVWAKRLYHVVAIKNGK